MAEDIFASFGGAAVKAEPETKPADPFAAFGGAAMPVQPAAQPQPSPAKQSTEDIVLEEAKKAGLTGKELAAFMAQAAHESHDFRAMSEYGGGKASYSGGTRFKGRGPLQLTHDYNYKKYGDRLKLDLLNKPELVEDPRVGTQVALEYWKDNVRPKVTNWDDVFQHSKAVNAPFAKVEAQVRGMESRKERYQRYTNKFAQPTEPVAQAATAPTKPAAPAAEEKDLFAPFRTRKDLEVVKKELQQFVSPEEAMKLDKEALENTPMLKPERVKEIRVLPSEIAALAKKYNVDPDTLKQFAPFFGAPMATTGFWEELKQTPTYLGGSISEMIGLGLPQKAVIEAQSNPAMVEALDDLRTIAQAKKPGAIQAAEFVGGVAKGVTAAAKVGALVKPLGKAAQVTATTATGLTEAGIAGAAQAERGKEVAGATTGVLFGTALTGAIGAVKAGAAAAKGINELRTKASKQLQQAEPLFFEKAAQEAKEKFSEGRTILNTAVLSNASIKGEDLQDAKTLASKLGQENVEALYKFAKDTRPDKVRRIEDEIAQASEKLRVQIDDVKTELGFAKMGPENMDFLQNELQTRAARLREGVSPTAAKTITEEIDQLKSLIRKAEASPERVAKLEQTLKGLELRLQKSDIDPKAAVARSTAENFVRGFASDILGSRIAYKQQDPLAALRVYTKDPEKLNAAMEQYFFKQHARAKIRSENYRALPEATPGLKRIGEAVQASRWTAESIDRKHGTNVQTIIDGMGRLYNDLHAYVRPRAEELSNLIQQTKAANVESMDLYNTLRTGEGADSPVAQSWRKFFNDGLEDAKILGLDIQARKNYVPIQMLPAQELAAVLTKRVEELKAANVFDLKNVAPTAEQVAELRKNPQVDELFKSLDRLIDGKDDYQSKLLSVLNDARTGAINRVIAARGLRRGAEAELPDLITDKDVGRLAQKWVESTYRSAVLRQPIAELRNYADLMKKVGDKNANRYLQNLVNDLTGMPRDGGLGRELSQLKAKHSAYLQEKALTAENPLARTLYSTVGTLSDMAPLLHKVMYAQALGGSVRQVVTNISSVATMTIPELGYIQGGKLVAKALVRVANDMMLGKEIVVRTPELARKFGVNLGDTVKTKNLARILQNEGLAASQWNETLERSLTTSLKRSGFENFSDKSIGAFGKLAMFAFETSENVMRSMTREIGADLAKLHGKGDKDYETFLDTLPRAYRKAVDGAKDEATRQKVLTDYVIAKTVFNYNQASASEVARSVGPILSSFTKWPTEIAGDTVNTFAKNGVTSGMADFTYRRLAPLFGLIFLGNLLGVQDQDKDSPLYQFVRRDSLAYMSPLNSLASLFEGDVAPPALSIPAQLGKAAVTADPVPASKALHDAIRLYIPGGGLISDMIKEYSDDKTK